MEVLQRFREPLPARPAEPRRRGPQRRGDAQRGAQPAGGAQEPERGPAQCGHLPEPVQRAVDQPDDERQQERRGQQPRVGVATPPGPSRRLDRGDQEATEEQEAHDAGVGEQAQLQAVRPAGLLAGVAQRQVVVAEVVLAQAADRMALEGVQRDAPIVVAAAADVGEVRAAVDGLRVGEPVPLAGDEAERVTLAHDQPAGEHTRDPDDARARCRGRGAASRARPRPRYRLSAHASRVPSTKAPTHIARPGGRRGWPGRAGDRRARSDRRAAAGAPG